MVKHIRCGANEQSETKALGVGLDMKDYTEGAFEALCWVKEMLRDKDKDRDKITEEIDGAVESMIYGFFVDFEAKIRRGY